MESKNAEFLREGLIETARKMTPLERLDAFVEHSLRMRSLMALGEKRRNTRVGQDPLPNG